MIISASDIARLRAQSSVGLMDCKRALEEAGGDFNRALDILREKGIAKAARRAEKVAAEGVVSGAVSADGAAGVLVEVNCETDFVGKNPDFIDFANHVTQAALQADPADLAALMPLPIGTGQTVGEAATHLSLKMGEKISVRRLVRLAAVGGQVAVYLHGSKIGVLVEWTGKDSALGLDLALQVAASHPRYLSREAVPPAELERERSVYAEQLKIQGKPEAMIVNIVRGKLEKFYGEVCLLEQPFIKNEEITITKLLAGHSATIRRFARFELGEGLVKEQSDFAAAVAEQLA